MRQVDFILGTLEALRPEVNLGALQIPSELLALNDTARAQRRQAVEEHRRMLEDEERQRRAAHVKQQEESRPARSAIRSREIRKRQKRK